METISLTEKKPIPPERLAKLVERRERLVALGYSVVDFEDESIKRITGRKMYDFDLWQQLKEYA